MHRSVAPGAQWAGLASSNRPLRAGRHMGIDPDGAYDPRLVNDRLLLGLKGTMSE
ncbi:hypothetical protein SS05631_a46770 (plasmid) [Sinorhizobium sp. CCBAU 05631]|nr:hypothetical protein SS05631_a46430 [Sinorhizobium sp. CCBAU 05631]ASY61060.1 hypothetical protein SS05631_a46770 [Sinorhizobium sp. CCBAU 05631]